MRSLILALLLVVPNLAGADNTTTLTEFLQLDPAFKHVAERLSECVSVRAQIEEASSPLHFKIGVKNPRRAERQLHQHLMRRFHATCTRPRVRMMMYGVVLGRAQVMDEINAAAQPVYRW